MICWQVFLRWENLIFSSESNNYFTGYKMEEKQEKPTKKDLMDMLDEMNASFDRMPLHVQCGYVTHCDLNAALLLIAQILKNKEA